MDIADWHRLAASPITRSKIDGDPYCLAYQSIMTFFDNVKEFDWDNAVIGLHIVYGWMPTIPKLEKSFGLGIEQRSAVIAVLNCVRAGNKVDHEAIKIVKAFTNNSVVGASKLLHFINPKTCPIWDSRVATVFHGKRLYAQALNKPETWLQYRDTLADWVSDPTVQHTCDNIRRSSSALRNATDMRISELILFHSSR